MACHLQKPSNAFLASADLSDERPVEAGLRNPFESDGGGETQAAAGGSSSEQGTSPPGRSAGAKA